MATWYTGGLPANLPDCDFDGSKRPPALRFLETDGRTSAQVVWLSWCKLIKLSFRGMSLPGKQLQETVKESLVGRSAKFGMSSYTPDKR